MTMMIETPSSSPASPVDTKIDTKIDSLVDAWDAALSDRTNFYDAWHDAEDAWASTDPEAVVVLATTAPKLSKKGVPYTKWADDAKRSAMVAASVRTKKKRLLERQARNAAIESARSQRIVEAGAAEIAILNLLNFIQTEMGDDMAEVAGVQALTDINLYMVGQGFGDYVRKSIDASNNVDSTPDDSSATQA